MSLLNFISALNISDAPSSGAYGRIATINITNSISLSDNVVCIEFDSNDILFDFVDPELKDIWFEDENEVELKYWVEYFDFTDYVAKIWVQVTGTGDFNIYMKYSNEDANNSSDPTIMTRVTSDASMSNFYPFLTDGTDGVGSSNFTLNNCAVSSSSIGNALSMDGSTSYATAALLNTGVPDGGFMASFMLKTDHEVGSANKDLIYKSNDANNRWEFRLTANGYLRVIITSSSGTADYNHEKTKWYAGEIITISMRWLSSGFLTVLVNNEHLLTTDKIPDDGSDEPLTLGAKNIGGVQSLFADVFVTDFALFDSHFDYRKERAWAEKIQVYDRTQPDKWIEQSTYPSSIVPNFTHSESSLIYSGSDLILYVKEGDKVADENRLLRVVSSDDGVTWGTPTIVLGYGVGGESGDVDRPNVWYDPNTSKYYCFYTPDFVDLYAVESVDGITFSNKRKILDAYLGVHGLHNSSTFWDEDDQKYKGYVTPRDVPGAPGRWSDVYYEGLTVDTLGYAGTNPQTSIVWPYPEGSTTGIGRFFKHNGMYYMYNHGSFRTIVLPSYGTFLSTSDPTDNSWVHKYKFPVLTYDTPTADDQRADIGFIDATTKCFLSSTNNDNQPLEGTVSIYKFGGTIDQIINDITINVSDDQGTPVPGDVDLVIFDGQSNNTGISMINDLPPQYDYTNNKVKIWNGLSFPNFAPGINNWGLSLQSASGEVPTDRWGPRISFADQCYQNNKEIYVVSVGRGGRGLAQDATTEDFSELTSAELHDYMTDEVDSAISYLQGLGKTVNIIAYFWKQGEADANDLTKANAYETNLDNKFDAITSYYSTHSIRFVIGKILDNTPQAYEDTVRTAQENVAAARADTIIYETNTFERYTPGNVHYGDNGYISLGLADYSAITDLL